MKLSTREKGVWFLGKLEFFVYWKMAASRNKFLQETIVTLHLSMIVWQICAKTVVAKALQQTVGTWLHFMLAILDNLSRLKNYYEWKVTNIVEDANQMSN